MRNNNNKFTIGLLIYTLFSRCDVSIYKEYISFRVDNFGVMYSPEEVEYLLRYIKNLYGLDPYKEFKEKIDKIKEGCKNGNK